MQICWGFLGLILQLVYFVLDKRLGRFAPLGNARFFASLQNDEQQQQQQQQQQQEATARAKTKAKAKAKADPLRG